MWDEDESEASLIPVDMVDEFLFDYNDKPGHNPTIRTLYGVRQKNKTRRVNEVVLVSTTGPQAVICDRLFRHLTTV